VEALSADNFLVAEKGGTVEDPVLSETFASLDGTPDAPSALQVLQTPAGEQVLVTNAGQDKVFVFTVLSPEATATPTQQLSFTSETNPGFTFSTTAVAEAPFAVVVTIEADTLPGGGSGNSTAQFIQAAQQTQVGGDDAGDAGGAVVVAAPATAPELVPGADGVPRIDLYRRTDVPDFPRPLSRQGILDAPWARDRALAVLEAGAFAADEGRELAWPFLQREPLPRDGVPTEVAVASLQARRAADVLWLEAPSWLAGRQNGVGEAARDEAAHAGAIAPTRREAAVSGRNEVTALVADEQRGRWLALLAALPGVGLFLQSGAAPDDPSRQLESRGRRSWSGRQSRQARPARGGREAGGES
jgi:hypothetical protein